MAKSLYTGCNRCKKDTNHEVLFNKKIMSSEFEVSDTEKIKDYEDYMVVQCKGCDNLSFVLRHSGKIYGEGKDAFYDANYPEIQYYQEYNLLSYDDQRELPFLLEKLYNEVESVFRAESNLLAGMGLRMLVEAICMEQNIAGRDLKIKIERLHEQGLISRNEVPILDKLRTIGNTSAHEIKEFSIEKLAYALDIVNHVLKSIYILPKINKRLKVTTVRAKPSKPSSQPVKQP